MAWLKGKTFNRLDTEGSAYVQAGPDAEDHQTTWCTEKAIQFIEANEPFNKPWLFSINMFDPHHPFDPPKDYMQRYLERLDVIPLPNYQVGELETKMSEQRFDHHGAYGKPDFYPYSRMTDHDHRMLKAAYWAMIDLIDEQVGRMMDALERTGQLNNTIIIFMSFHGELLGDHGVYLKGSFFYEPSVNVPLIVSYPDHFGTNQRVSQLVELVDIAPTLLEAAGLPKQSGMQAKSLRKLLTEAADARSEPHRDDVYCKHYNARSKQDGVGGFATMVRTEEHKLVMHHQKGEAELYDLLVDPNESVNLWNRSEASSVQMKMLVRLCDRIAETVDPLPQRLSQWY